MIIEAAYFDSWIWWILKEVLDVGCLRKKSDRN